jgi:hypothetical protein
MRIILVALAILIASPPFARGQCGDPPTVVDQSLKGELEGKAKFLSGWIGDAGLKGQIETARTDVLNKYPNADHVRNDAYLLYVFCTFVLSDAKLTAQEKFQNILLFRQTINPAPK